MGGRGSGTAWGSAAVLARLVRYGARFSLVSVLIVLVCACSSHKSERKAEEVAAPQSNSQAEYVSGIAAAYYCTCKRWPASWAELRDFDDYLHKRSQDEGEAPMKRYDWSSVKAEVSVHADGSMIIRPGAEIGAKTADQNDAKLKEDKLEPIAVPTPNCSRFDSGRFAGGCVRSAALAR